MSPDQDTHRSIPMSPLDRAVDAVAAEPVAPEVVAAAAVRVWERLAQGSSMPAANPMAVNPMLANSVAARTDASQASPAAASTMLRDCADFQRLIPAYLLGELPPARTLLLEDHARSCIACRKALKAAVAAEEDRRAGVTRPAASLDATAGTRARRLPRGVFAALAAAFLAALGFGLFALYQQLPGAGEARVEAAQGGLYRVASQSVVPLAAGARFAAGQEVRTGRGAHAVLRLADGSRVEVSDRAALSYDARRGGITVDLAQGRIIVQAAKQTAGRHLYVETPDCRVSVVGTIFAVNHGTKGSRVSVVQGEVRVRQARGENVLYPGGQVTTRASVTAVPVADEIAWSADAGRYRELLSQLAGLSAEADAQTALPGLRTATTLLDLAPAGTLVWVGLPNVATNLASTQSLLDQRLAENPLLRQWWDETMGSAEKKQRFHEAIQTLSDLGRYLGEEVGIAVTPDGPVVLAQVTDPAAFRSVLEQEVAKIDAGGSGRPQLTIVDSPAAALPGAATAGHALLLWPAGPYVVAAPSAALLSRAAAVLAQPGANPFLQTAFHERVAAAYHEGAGWLFAGNLKAILARRPAAAGDNSTAEALGLMDLDGVVVDRRDAPGKTETRAAVTFDRPRRGIASWLAAPAPMGALSFISPDATLAAAFVVKNPASLLDDLLAALPRFGEDLARLESEHGVDVRGLAAPLGGEIALAVDGPLLPEPSWKLIAEVYDPAALEGAMEQLSARLDQSLRAQGKPGLALTQETAGGRTFHTLRAPGTAAGREVDYTFADGYLVAAPSRALLERAIATRASGSTLATSARLQTLLPHDGQVNVSAFLYQNLGPALDPLSGTLGAAASAANAAAGPGRAPAFARLLAVHGPSLTYAYAEDDRILFAAASDPGPLGQNLGLLARLGSLMGAMGHPGAQPGAAAQRRAH
jgi:hypothetical protein